MSTKQTNGGATTGYKAEELREQQAEGARLDAAVTRNLRALGSRGR